MQRRESNVPRLNGRSSLFTICEVDAVAQDNRVATGESAEPADRTAACTIDIVRLVMAA